MGCANSRPRASEKTKPTSAPLSQKDKAVLELKIARDKLRKHQKKVAKFSSYRQPINLMIAITA